MLHKSLTLVAYISTIPAANWMIHNFGTCVPDGPCLVPVGFGLSAPSGVLMIGAALALRDMVQNQLGAKWAIGAIFAGAGLSLLVASPSLAIASFAAFLLSELADMAVYSPLRRRNQYAAVLASGAVGAVIDSAVFLMLAFGSLDFIAGQVVGKMWMAFAAVIAIAGARKAGARKAGGGLRIEEGTSYRRVNGEVVGPASHNERSSDNASYPWLLGNVTYTNRGREIRSDWSENDLVAKVPNPKTTRNLELDAAHAARDRLAKELAEADVLVRELGEL